MTLYIILSIVLFTSFKKCDISGVYLPIGYSVFMFSAFSLLYDCQRSKAKYHRLEIFIYLFFFPKAFAGPIERADEFIPQLQKPQRLTNSRIYSACKLLLFACFCKYVISDNLYNIDCDSVKGINLLLSVISYALAFYFDFYAYSLFAVGFGKLLGIDLTLNFSSPYSSKTFKEFWTRWNITLSSWLKDYIYIPLGGSRINQIRTIVNVFIVFFISAIWHDCTFPFVIWGLCHAILIIIEKRTNISSIHGYRYLVFLLVCYLWQLFRIEDLNALKNMFEHMFVYDGISYKLFLSTILSLIVMVIIENKMFKQLIFSKDNSTRYIYKEVGVLALILTMIVLMPHTLNINFFYLRF